MNYLSVCSGIEAASVAWHPFDWHAVAYSEIEPFPSAVLAHHYPNVPNVGDMTKYKEWNLDRTVDLIVGGTPCQSFSVAGLRKGLEDPRGNLALVYCGLLDHFRPRWFVWENVPGVLSSSAGRDFGSFLGALVELGYGFAYRVLDAQWFGVAQRRRRVFVVGYLGDWRPAAAVLFERESLRRHPAPSRETWQEVAGTFTARAKSGGWGQDPNLAAAGYMRPVAKCLTAKGNMRYDWETEDLIPAPIALAENTIGRQPHNGGNGDGFTEGGPMYTLNATGVHGVAQPIPCSVARPVVVHGTQDPCTSDIAFAQGRNNAGENVVCVTGEVTHTLKAEGFDASEDGTGRGQPIVSQPIAWSEELTPSIDVAGTIQYGGQGGRHDGVMTHMAVRRLTPVECERLQGFPDNYTNIPWRKKPESPDGPRYKALGNSMAVPVMHWIGRNIQVVDGILK